MGITVCIGGLIAVGKTTLIERLVQQCHESAVQCRVMAEMYSAAMKEMVAANLPVADAFLLAHRLQMAVDADDVARGYDVVLMERSFIDHLAFHEAFLECGIVEKELVTWSKRVVREIDPPKPQCFVYLDVDPAVAYKRKADRENKSDEVFHAPFMAALQRAYQRLIAEYYDDPIVLDWSAFGDELCLNSFIKSLLADQSTVSLVPN